jgi:N-acyl-phosphatidylethanolamine-hydrolysing phospholipase D
MSETGEAYRRAGAAGRRIVLRHGGAALLTAIAGCAGRGDAPMTSPDPTRPWHHAGTGFRNPPGSPVPGGAPGDWATFFWRRLAAGSPTVELPAGHVRPPRAVQEGIAALGERDGITWLGHASYLIRLGGRTLVTDPFLTDHASPVAPLGPRRFAPPGLRAAALPRTDIVLLSHNHYDHLDLPSLAAIGAAWRPRLVTALKVGGYVETATFRGVHELDWYETAAVDGLAITAVPAVHFSKRTLTDRNASLWCGFVVSDGRRRIYIAGDTAYGPVFAAIGRRLPPPDLAIVPIGAYAPRELMRGAHCTPEEAVRIGRDLGAARLAAMHWGSIMLTDEPPFEPPERFRAAARADGRAAAEVLVPAIGETIAL